MYPGVKNDLLPLGFLSAPTLRFLVVNESLNPTKMIWLIPLTLSISLSAAITILSLAHGVDIYAAGFLVADNCKETEIIKMAKFTYSQFAVVV
jgi:hypothetical protein